MNRRQFFNKVVQGLGVVSVALVLPTLSNKEKEPDYTNCTFNNCTIKAGSITHSVLWKSKGWVG